MCGKVIQSESISTMLGVLSHLYGGRPEDASLLLDLYGRSCRENGAEDDCVLGSMLSASVFLTMNLLGREGEERVRDMSLWWAAQCPR